ncbi:MAG TPA: NAD-dependent epimerase/dehydratase family protein [Deltaproteobacteria bacterium]|nr:NAD-dependent epimerase/dehydratase family protein [Deltaproteobacteria bacterium]
MSVVALTGCSGYLGQRLLAALEGDEHVSKIVGIDVKPPSTFFGKLDFYCMDVRDSEIPGILQRTGTEKIVHLAFIVDAIHDTELMHSINIDGTRTILAAASECAVEQLVIASSTTIFMRPSPIPRWSKEDDLPYPHPRLGYISDKFELESMVRSFRIEHPETRVAVVRPAIVWGPNVNNYISRYLTRMPVIIAVGRSRPELQFVHEDDVAKVFTRVVQLGAEGYFHAVGAGTIRLDTLARILGKTLIGIPSCMLYPLVDLLWKLHAPFIEGPSAALDGIRYPWVVDDQKTRKTLGLGPRRSVEEVLRLVPGNRVLQRDHGQSDERSAR